MTTPSVRLTSQDRLEGSLILEHRRSGSGHVAIVSRITDRARQAGQIIAEEVAAWWAALTRVAETETSFSAVLGFIAAAASHERANPLDTSTRLRTRSRCRTPWSRPRTGAARARSPAR